MNFDFLGTQKLLNPLAHLKNIFHCLGSLTFFMKGLEKVVIKNFPERFAKFKCSIEYMDVFFLYDYIIIAYYKILIPLKTF